MTIPAPLTANTELVDLAAIPTWPTFRRLATLLRLAEGAWALALFEDGAVQRRATEELRRILAPLPVIECQLTAQQADPLSFLQGLPTNGQTGEPVVVFTGVGAAFPALFGYLDVQREALARLPYRLLFWVDSFERRSLAENAPNFYSRLSGVFLFTGTSSPAGVMASSGETHAPPAIAVGSGTRRRPLIEVADARDRQRRGQIQRRRIAELRALPHPDEIAIGDAWYDLAGLYETDAPRRWAEAEVAYGEAARAYGAAGTMIWKAEALYQAGDAAYRAYLPEPALEHLRAALTLYQLHRGDDAGAPHARLGEANVLRAIGDVQQFRDDMAGALASYGQALDLYRQVGDRLGEANVLAAIGDVQQFRKEMAGALASYGQALELYRQVGSRRGEANVLVAMGQLELIRGQPTQAKILLHEAVQIYEAIGDRYSIAAQIGNYGWTLRRIGQAKQARPYLLEAARLFEEIGLTDYAQRHRQAAGS